MLTPQLKSEVFGEEPPLEININEGNLPADKIDINMYKEFEDYQYLKVARNIVMDDEAYGYYQNTGLTGKVIYYLGTAFRKLKEKLSEIGFQSKIMTGGDKAFKIIKGAGKYFVVYGTPVAIAVGSKTLEGVNVLKEKTVQIYKNLTQKETVMIDNTHNYKDEEVATSFKINE
jgi:hypothetical protein